MNEILPLNWIKLKIWFDLPEEADIVGSKITNHAFELVLSLLWILVIPLSFVLRQEQVINWEGVWKWSIDLK